MKTNGVIITCVVLTFCSLFFLSEVHHNLNGIEEQQELTMFWKRQAAVGQLRLAVSQSKFADFKQDVALLIPNAEIDGDTKKEDQQSLRNLASVIPHHKIKFEVSGSAETLFKKGKKLVVAHKYEEGIAVLKDLIYQFPDSYHVVEAHYLLMESYYNLKKFEDVVASVDGMVDIFPENRLTGFALLKMGALYEKENRLEDALQVYRTILSVFQDDPGLMQLADQNVKQLEL